MSNPFAGLDDVEWSSLSHAYGRASGVPAMLRALLSPDLTARRRVWGDLWSTIYHQGSLYSATPAAVPFLCRVARAPELDDRPRLVRYLAHLTGGERWFDFPPGAHFDWEIDAHEKAHRAEDARWVEAARRALSTEADSLAPLLANDDAATRAAAAFALASIRDPSFAPLLRRGWEDRDCAAKAASILGVFRCGGDDEADQARALERLRNVNEAAMTRLACAMALALRCGPKAPPEAESALLDALGAHDDELRDAWRGTPWNDDDGDEGSLLADAASSLCRLGCTEARARAVLAALEASAELGSDSLAIFDAAIYLAFGGARPSGPTRPLFPASVSSTGDAPSPEVLTSAASLTPLAREALETIALVEWPYANVSSSLIAFRIPGYRDDLVRFLDIPLARLHPDPEDVKELEPSAAQLAELLEAPERFPALRELTVRGIPLGDDVAARLGAHRGLTLLMLEDNGIQRLPEAIFALHELERLVCMHNPLASCEGPFARLDRLVFVNLGGTPLRAVPEAILSAPALETVYLDECPLADPAADLVRLARVPRLKTLSLQGVGLRAVPREIGLLRGLEVLAIGNNPLETLPEQLAALPSLTSLGLSGTGIAKMPSVLAALPKLANLNVASTPLARDRETYADLVRHLPHVTVHPSVPGA